MMLSPNFLTHPDFCGHLNGRFEVASGPARHIGWMAALADNPSYIPLPPFPHPSPQSAAIPAAAHLSLPATNP